MSISLAKRNGSEGYQVRVMRNGVSHSKFFKKKRGAKKAALGYEMDLIEQLGPPVSQIGSIRGRPRKNRGLWESEIKGWPYVCASSRYPNGQPKTIVVSITKYGKREAQRIARSKKQAADKLAYSEMD